MALLQAWTGADRTRRRRLHERRLRCRARTDPAVRRAHRQLRPGLWRYLCGGDLPTLMTAPVVYSLIIPLVALDVWVWVFQVTCFRAWGVASVRRRPYLVFDRQKLAYLNGIEKLNCVFCGYANGLIAYVREVASRTEQYWCPIRHGRRVRDPHWRYAQFVDYGDAEAYRHALPVLRQALRTDPSGAASHPRRSPP